MKPLPLARVLKVGYQNQDKQQKKLGKYGYTLDKSLSNDNEQVYYQPKKNKLLVNVAGTHNLNDVGTDVALAVGGLKSTKRYNEAKTVLNKAKEKYNNATTTITGHSLGATVGQGIASKNDKVYTLNGGYTVGQNTKGGSQHNYRTAGDVVSLLGSGNKNLKTVGKRGILDTAKDLFTGGLLKLGQSTLEAHSPSSLKGEHIYIR